MGWPEITRLRDVSAASKVVAQDMNGDYIGTTNEAIQDAIDALL